jgi:hypothetical protein
VPQDTGQLRSLMNTINSFHKMWGISWLPSQNRPSPVNLVNYKSQIYAAQVYEQHYATEKHTLQKCSSFISSLHSSIFIFCFATSSRPTPLNYSMHISPMVGLDSFQSVTKTTPFKETPRKTTHKKYTNFMFSVTLRP